MGICGLVPVRKRLLLVLLQLRVPLASGGRSLNSSPSGGAPSWHAVFYGSTLQDVAVTANLQLAMAALAY